MKKSQIFALVMGIIAVIVIAIVIYLHYNGVKIISGKTPLLNCAGLTVRGDYVYLELNIPSPRKINIIVWSNKLPPSDFDIYVMTPEQYNDFTKSKSSFDYVDGWDLTQHWSFSRGEYYLSEELSLVDSYYIIISNDYLHPFQGVYGQASYQIKEKF
ncbi:MAG: hypothetical protein M1542_08290 [Thermotogae bacterium]|jgi:hypothetical protein|nr:hypothetical protein [Thermotogota bacterium]MCL5033226.1 hypothetical protein [Thermotogota bacterium]